MSWRPLQIAFAVVSIVCCMGFASQTRAQSKTYEIGIFHLPPLGEYDGRGQIIGVIPDIFEQLEKESGLRFTYRLLPYARMLWALQHGTIDFAIFLERPPDEPGITRIERTHFEEILVYHQKTHNNVAWEDMDDGMIAVPIGVNFGEKFKKNTKIQRHYIRHYRHSISMLRQQRVNAIIGPKSALIYNFKLLNIPWTDYADPLVMGYQKVFLHASSRKFTTLPVQRMAKALRTIRQSGKIQKILVKYYGKEGVVPLQGPQLVRYSLQ